MKTFIILFAAGCSLSLFSCGGNSSAANKMAEEMCAAMDKFNEGDVNSMMEAATAMMEITKKEDEYGAVTEPQLEKAMEEKCPEGWAKFKSLTNPEK